MRLLGFEMFQKILTIVTATTFVAHGLFGCCWHHGHTHLVSECGTAKHSAGHAHGHHHHDGDGAVADGEHGENHDSQYPHPLQCDEGDCVFARTHDGPSVSADVLAASAVLLAPALPCECPPTVTGEGPAFAAHGPAACSSAPLCALSQVWLI